MKHSNSADLKVETELRFSIKGRIEFQKVMMLAWEEFK